MKVTNRSFQFDRRARSFRVSDFALRDLPLLALAIVSLTVFSLGVGWVIEFLPPNGRWVCLGLAAGFSVGFVFGSWFRQSAARPSDRGGALPASE